MRIVVCIKQVPASNEQRLDPVTGTVIREGVESILNPFDAFAVEEAVRLRRRAGGTVSALSMGVPSVRETLQRVLAVGVDDAYLLSDRAFAGADTLATARALALGVGKMGGADLILCGRMATDGDTAQVGPMLAGQLGIPHVSDVARVDEISESHIVVTRMTDDGYLRVRVPLPTLITVVKEINVPRLPSVSGVLRSVRADVTVWSAQDVAADPETVGLRGSATKVVRSVRPERRGTCRMFDSTQALFNFLKEEKLLQSGPAKRADATEAASGAFSINPAQAHGVARGGVWVFCEPCGKDGRMDEIRDVRGVAHELIGEAKRLAAATGTGVTAVLPGTCPEPVISALAASGADAVLCLKDDSLVFPDELAYSAAMERVICEYEPAVLLFGATAFGRSMAPRLASALKTGLTADCTKLEIDPETGLLLQTRPAFGGNLLATITCPAARPQMATVRPKVFPRPAANAAHSCAVAYESGCGAGSPVEVLDRIPGERGVNIADSDILVAVGMGVGGAENIRMAERLAERLGGTLAASRALVDAGAVPYARQVGQTGKTVAPKLYFALGISGAIQHMAGVGAEKIIAINTDPDAPIFEYAHYGIQTSAAAFLQRAMEEN